MKSFVAVLALVALAAADVSHILNQGGPEAGAQIVAQESDVRPDGYAYGYQTSNGITGQESGSLKNVGLENEAIQVTGSNSYISPEGIPIEVKYIADESGYRAEGLHLPTPPPTQAIPEYILRSLEYNAKFAPPPEVAAKRPY